MRGDVEISTVDLAQREVAILQLDEMAQTMKAAFSFMDVRHTFGDGIYTRTGRIAAGNLIIGAKHRARNIFHLARGTVIVWDCFHGVRTLTAPFSEMTVPGTQRIGFVVEEIEGSNIFETDATNFNDVEREMLFPFELPMGTGEKMFQLLARSQEKNALLV